MHGWRVSESPRQSVSVARSHAWLSAGGASVIGPLVEVRPKGVIAFSDFAGRYWDLDETLRFIFPRISRNILNLSEFECSKLIIPEAATWLRSHRRFRTAARGWLR